MPSITTVGREWLVEEVDEMIDGLDRTGPVAFNEANRYLPDGLTRRPGYIRYDLFPYLIEILECFDPLSPVREVNLMKGVQTGYTTLLESILLYYIGQIRSQGGMFLTADDGLASTRMENNILPMINESGFADNIRSADIGNNRKTGKTKDFLQWLGGGFLIYNGAQNATKMRMTSVPLMLKDELDGWKRAVGKDGNSDTLTDARLSTYWDVRKILRGSTPLTEPSMINEAYERGDKREYLVLCKACSFPQKLKHEYINKETGVVGGYQWEMDSDGVLILESVCYCCKECGYKHYEGDKERLFSREHGAHWKPTAKPREPGIRSYHLPAFYSPFGFRPWYKNVSDYLAAFDPETKQIIDIGKYQEWYNNTLGKQFRVKGSKIRFESVSAHRRPAYRLGQVPNAFATKYCGSPVLMLLCMVDVHARNLAVSVFGIARDFRLFVIDYWRFEAAEGEDDCSESSSPVWGRLRELIEEEVYTADDGKQYKITITFVDASYSNATVTDFCADYASGVYPILGRDRAAKNQIIKEFAEFTTQSGTVGYRILVDHYKDRLAPVLRREWVEEAGEQRPYHFNAPTDLLDKQILELTAETRKKETDDKGVVTYVWHRPGNKPNELWDLLVYCHAAVEVLAWAVCIQHFELETVDWPKYWDYIETEKLYYTD